jgi:hypothetical protein
MAQPTSRDTLIDFCLRRLGAPVIDINVDIDQIEDKVDDALQLYQEYHTDATIRTYVQHQVTQTDIDNNYISVASNVLYVSRVFPKSSTIMGEGMWNIEYQMHLNDSFNLYRGMADLQYFTQMKQYISLLDMTLRGEPIIQFSRHQDKLYVFSDLDGKNFKIGDYIVYEAMVNIDPETYNSIYNDVFIKDYVTALIKQQWGANLMKFEGVQMPGGITFNGRQYYEDATAELPELRERLRMEQELPIDFLVG